MPRVSMPMMQMPCGPCYRDEKRYTPSTWFAANSIRKMVMCERHYNLFKEADQDAKGMINTAYIKLTPDMVGTIDDKVLPPTGTNGFYLDNKGTRL